MTHGRISKRSPMLRPLTLTSSIHWLIEYLVQDHQEVRGAHRGIADGLIVYQPLSISLSICLYISISESTSSTCSSTFHHVQPDVAQFQSTQLISSNLLTAAYPPTHSVLLCTWSTCVFRWRNSLPPPNIWIRVRVGERQETGGINVSSHGAHAIPQDTS